MQSWPRLKALQSRWGLDRIWLNFVDTRLPQKRITAVEATQLYYDIMILLHKEIDSREPTARGVLEEVSRSEVNVRRGTRVAVYIGSRRGTSSRHPLGRPGYLPKELVIDGLQTLENLIAPMMFEDHERIETGLIYLETSHRVLAEIRLEAGWW